MWIREKRSFDLFSFFIPWVSVSPGSDIYLIHASSLLALAGDEMFSDSYKMKLVDEVIYEVYGKVRFMLSVNTLNCYMVSLLILFIHT